MPGAAEAELPPEAFYLRLPEYLARLRLEGLVIGAEQESRLFLLLSRLEGAGTLPKMAGALARFVVPVLACTPAQQAICHSHFQAMFSGLSIAPNRPETPSTGGRRAEEWKIWPRLVLRTGVTRATVVLMIVATLAIVVLTEWNGRPRVVEGPVVVPGQTTPRSDNNDEFREWIRDYPLKELELPKQAPWNRTLRWFYSEFGWQKFEVAALPWLVYGVAFGALVYLTLAHLRREALRQNLRTLPFSFRGDRPRFGDRALLADLQPLRSLARVEIRDIDTETTIIATAKRGGLLTLRWVMRPVPIDFVVLIDRRSQRDHLAAYGDTMAETLRSSGLFVEQFDFDRSPRICRRRRSGEIESLHSVLSGFPGSVFLFFVSESELLDPSLGRPRAWIDEIVGMTNTFLMVPEAAAAASPTDWPLPDGLVVAAASPAGLRAIAARLLARAVPDAVRTPIPELSRLVARINERADRWMQSAPPDAAEIDVLVSELREAAGADTYRWIAATSVYPELRWAMTLYLRDRLGVRRGPPAVLAPDLLDVIQLPWFRRGWMPDWVRTRLLKELSGSEHRKVRSLLIEAMGISTGAPRAPAMEISIRNQVGAPPTERVRSDSILVDYLLPILASASQFFALPEEWARKIGRRPLRRLSVVAVCGAMLAAIGSFGALALMPIDECDLWGSSPSQRDNVGPPLTSLLLERAGYVAKVVAACRAAMEREPKVRYRLQYARALNTWALTSKSNVPPSEIELARAILFDLDDVGYLPAAESIAFEYHRGVFPHDNRKAEEYWRRTYNLGSLEAARNLARLYQEPEFDSPYYRNERRRLLAEYEEKGGAILMNYALSFRDGTFGISPDTKKYLELVQLGVKRNDGGSAAELGYLYETGNICTDCTPDYESAKKYYLKAIEWSASPYAASRLASIYYEGSGTEKDIDRALYWAIFSSRLGEEDNADELINKIIATLAASKPPEGGLPTLNMNQLMESAKGGNKYSQFFVGELLETYRKNEEALIWYREASHQGLKDATAAANRLSLELNQPQEFSAPHTGVSLPDARPAVPKAAKSYPSRARKHP